MNIFQQAHKNLPLSPTERAILKFFYMTAATAALTGLTAAIQYVGSNGHNIDGHTVLFVFMGAFGGTVVETVRKFVTAHSDGPIGAATQLLTAAIQKAATPTTPTTPTTPAPTKASVK